MCLTEKGMFERKWGSYAILGDLLDRQEPSLSPEERLASFRPSTSRSEEEYWSDCLDIYRRLRGYVEGQEKSENYPSLNHRQRHLLHLDLEQLEHRVRQISIRFSNVVEDIERLRISI